MKNILILMFFLMIFSIQGVEASRKWPVNSTQPKMRMLEVSTIAGVTEWTPTFYSPTFSATNDINTTTNIFTKVDHEFESGDKVRIVSAGTLPAPLDQDTDYYIVDVSDDTFQLMTLSGTSAIDLTSKGTTAHVIYRSEFDWPNHGLVDQDRVQVYSVAATKAAVTFSSTTQVDATLDTFNNGVAHGFITGDRVRVTTTATLPTGLTAGTDYWVYTPSTTSATLQLAATLEAATFGATMVNVTTTGSGVQTITESATIPTGMALTTDYWVKKVNKDKFNLMSTYYGTAPIEWTDVSTETMGIGKVTIKKTDELYGLAERQVTMTASATGIYIIEFDENFGSDKNVHVQVTPKVTDCKPFVTSKAKDKVVITTEDGTDGTTDKDCIFDALIIGSEGPDISW